MAKPPETKKPLKVKLDEDQIEATEADEAEVAALVEAPVSVSKPAQKAAPAIVEKQHDDIVTFVMHQSVEPAPVVGSYSFRENGVMVLKARESYQMPRHVAMHLLDKRLGIVV